MRRVTAEELAAKKGSGATTKPAVNPPQPRITVPSGNASPHPYAIANAIPTADVCAAYGLGAGNAISCPVCKAVGSWVNKGGLGFQCFHATCHKFSADNLGVVAAVTALGATKGDGEDAKANRRAAYNDLRSKFAHLPELRLSRENRAQEARTKLAEMDVDGAGELAAARDVNTEATPTCGESGAGPSGTDPGSPPPAESARPAIGRRPGSAKLEPDLPRIRERLALLLDLPVDEREAELDRILSIYKTTKTVLRATLHELDAARRRGQVRASGKPQIRVTTDLALMHDAAIAALASDAGLYRRGSDPRERLARVLNGQIDLLPAECLPERLTTAADWLDDDGPALPSDRSTKAIFARGSYPGMRAIRGVVRQPTLLADGRVLTTVGYDADSCLIYEPDGPWPELPAMPVGGAALKAVALKAKANIDEVVEDFPFVPPSKAVWLALVLTIEGRFYVEGPLPQFACTANVPGAGKGALAKLAGIITTGEDPEARALPTGANAEEEIEKRLTGIAVGGTALVFFDEVSRLDSKNLQRIATSRVYAGRILGATGDYRGRLDAVVAYAGNNMEIAGDMGRRILPCVLESPYEDPSKRPASTYKHPARAGEGGTLLRWCADNRRQLHIDALTMLRAFLLAKPKVTIGAFGSFEEWAALVVACLVWLGEPDITATAGRLEDDPQRNTLGAVLSAWQRAFGDAQVWAADVVRFLESNVYPPSVTATPEPETVSFGEKAVEDPRQGLAAALRDVCECRDGLYPTVQALGGWLARIRNRPVGGLKITAEYDSHRKQNAWKLMRVVLDDRTAAGSSPPGAGIPSTDTRTGESLNEAPAGIAGICGYHFDSPRVGDDEERKQDHNECGKDTLPHASQCRADTAREIPAIPAAPASCVLPDTYGAGISGSSSVDARDTRGGAGVDLTIDEIERLLEAGAPTADTPTAVAQPIAGRPTRSLRARLTSAYLERWPPPAPREDAWTPCEPPAPGRLVVILSLDDGGTAYSVTYGSPIWPERTVDGLRGFGWHGERDAKGQPIVTAVELQVVVQRQFVLGFGEIESVLRARVGGPAAGVDAHMLASPAANSLTAGLSP